MLATLVAAALLAPAWTPGLRDGQRLRGHAGRDGGLRGADRPAALGPRPRPARAERERGQGAAARRLPAPAGRALAGAAARRAAPALADGAVVEQQEGRGDRDAARGGAGRPRGAPRRHAGLPPRHALLGVLADHRPRAVALLPPHRRAGAAAAPRLRDGAAPDRRPHAALGDRGGRPGRLDAVLQGRLGERHRPRRPPGRPAPARPRARLRRDPHDDLRHPPRRQGDAPRRRAAAAALAGAASAVAARASSAATSAGSPASGGCSARKRSAARRPPSARRPRAPCSATKSASAPRRRVRTRTAGRSIRSRWASRAAISSSMPWSGWTLETAITSVVAVAQRAQGGAQVAHGADGHDAEVGLRDHEHVGHLHDPGLQELQRVAGAGLDDHRDRVGRLGDLGLGLADADGLDHDDVERGRQRLRGGARGGGEAAEPLAGGHRADEDAAVGGVGVDPGAVAEQRAARALGGRVDREHRHASARCGASAATSALSSVDLPAPGGPVTPTTCAGASPPSASGDTAAEQRRDLRPQRRRAVLDEIQRRRRRRSGPARAAARRGRAAGRGAPRGAGRRRRPALAHAAVAMPFRSATRPTTSRRIRLSSKSFGV